MQITTIILIFFQQFGKQQCFELGEYTRRQYGDFISNYSKNDFDIFTTYKERNQMSAQTFLAGLFPPTGDSVWDKTLLWQPIPIRPLNKSILFHAVNDFCPIYDAEVTEISRKNLTIIYQKYEDVMKYINQNTGNNITVLVNLMFLYDTLQLEKKHNFFLPSWTEKIFPEPLNKFRFLSYDSWAYTKRMRRLGKQS